MAAAPDLRDDVIEAFAHSEAALVDRIVDLIADRDAYRAIAQQLLHGLHRVAAERDRLRKQRALDRRHARDQQRTAA